MKRIIVCTFIVAMLAGCGPEVGGSKRDWFGNARNDTCSIPGGENAPLPRKAKDFGDQTQFLRIMVAVTADEFPIRNGREVCLANRTLPFLIHIYGQTNKAPGIKMETTLPLPWNNRGQPLLTPHREWFFVSLDAAWFTINVVATHQLASGINLKDHPRTVLRCGIFVRGQRVVAEAKTITGTSNTVQCSIRMNI